nr:MAG TPA: hypothetical protein [Caudoviricetes sp.]
MGNENNKKSPNHTKQLQRLYLKLVILKSGKQNREKLRQYISPVLSSTVS